MDIVKIVCVAIAGAIIFLYLKSNGSELSSLVAIATGIIVLLLTVSYIVSALSFFRDMALKTGVDSSVFVLIIKIVAISYVADFSSSLCEDMGIKSLGEKVNFASRIIIFVMATPIFSNLINIISTLLI